MSLVDLDDQIRRVSNFGRNEPLLSNFRQLFQGQSVIVRETKSQATFRFRLMMSDDS